MKRLFILGLTFLMGLVGNTLLGQTNWRKVDRLLERGADKSAYERAEAVYRSGASPRERLIAACYMARAGASFQENFMDSTTARYRALLPELEGVERAVCWALLGEVDSAMADTLLLQRTLSKRLRPFCVVKEGRNMTPTAYDVVAASVANCDTIDSGRRLEVLRSLVAFHGGDGDEIRLWWDLQLIELLSWTNYSDNNMTLLQGYLDKYRGSRCPLLARFYEHMSRCLENERRYVEAVAYCDTAISLFPGSKGAVECEARRQRICSPSFSFAWSRDLLVPGRATLVELWHRNVGQLYLSVYPYEDGSAKDAIDRGKAITSWVQTLTDDGAHKCCSTAIAVPALPAGRYLLTASLEPDDTRKCAYVELPCTEMRINNVDGRVGQIIDAVTGGPIVGQEVVFSEADTPIDTVVTDSNGRFFVPMSNPSWRFAIRVTRSGFTYDRHFYTQTPRVDDDSIHASLELVQDRPVYRTGDTVHLAFVAYQSDKRNGKVVPNVPVYISISNPNGREVDSVTVTADSLGSGHTFFVIPRNGLVGEWFVHARAGENGNGTGFFVKVAEYKPPKFTVQLDLDGGNVTVEQAPRFGNPLTVRGEATSYTGVAVAGSKVHYTVRRDPYFFSRQYYYYRSVEVAQGDTVADADGRFAITFVPLPDSSGKMETDMSFSFTVHAYVTDINGETHDASTEVRVGCTGANLKLPQFREKVSGLGTLCYSLIDHNGRPLEGDVQIALERLALPRPMLFTPMHLIGDSSMYMNIPEEEYRRLFPHYFYSREESSRDLWKTVGRTVVEHHAEGGRELQNVALPDLPSGYYRVTLTCGELKHVGYFTLTKPGERRVQSPKVMWFDGADTAHVGERYALRFGSLRGPLKVFYVLTGRDDVEFETRWLTAGEEIDSITFTVDSTMLGGVTVCLVAVTPDGRTYDWRQEVEVPFDHKRLTVQVATFRDRLVPGEEEEWTLTVKDNRNAPVAGAGLVLGMYDASLDEYGSNNWELWPWYSWRNTSVSWLGYYKASRDYDIPDVKAKDKDPKYGWWRLMDGYAVGKGYDRWMGESVAECLEIEHEIVVEDAPDACPREVNPSRISKSAAREPLSGDIMDEGQELVLSTAFELDDGNVSLRTKLRTLAFFAPALRTSKDGSVSYRFTVPEVLTRWRIKGMAFTKDLRSGTFERQLVTSKPMMVQPNMPRFLRQGDSLSLMAKVVLKNEELRIKNEEMPVVVSLLLTDAETGDTFCHERKTVQLRDAASVMFDVVVPRHVNVAVYRIVAHGEGMSDGEQGQLAVVSDRQAVTVSQTMYVNGVGEKHINLPLKEYLSSPTAEPNLLAAEVVGNPVWLALKAMPHLAEVENPSNLYLANSLYTNSMAYSVLKDFKGLRDLKDFRDTAEVPFWANPDVKQILLEATPWLRDAQAEVEQRKAMAAYFDSVRMAEELPRMAAQLAGRQNADGGWSWMPDGESSVWVTRQITKLLCIIGDEMKECADRAFAYLDMEEQKYYAKYVKPSGKKGGESGYYNVDYLYTRSFRGKAKTEAYRYYYANALKHYTEYDNLYTQAQLALVFQRGGNEKEARDIIRRIKEKSLVSDEMGMYWRDNKRGWCWNERPIETQALLIRAFLEVDYGNIEYVPLMQQWLLKQKQTTHWGNDVATVEAIRSILIVGYGDNHHVADGVPTATLTVGDTMISSIQSPIETLQIQHSSFNIPHSDTLPITFTHHVSGPAWASVHFQYTDQMDSLPATSSGITVARSYQMVSTPRSPLSTLRVGDRVKVCIEFCCDRALDYLEVMDMRPSCFEPVRVEAGWRWSNGLRYYAAPGNTVSRFFIDHVEKGTYRLEYDVYVTNPGRFKAGAATVQCLYAPEFRASSPSGTVEAME